MDKMIKKLIAAVSILGLIIIGSAVANLEYKVSVMISALTVTAIICFVTTFVIKLSKCRSFSRNIIGDSTLKIGGIGEKSYTDDFVIERCQNGVFKVGLRQNESDPTVTVSLGALFSTLDHAGQLFAIEKEKNEYHLVSYKLAD